MGEVRNGAPENYASRGPPARFSEAVDRLPSRRPVRALLQVVPGRATPRNAEAWRGRGPRSRSPGTRRLRRDGGGGRGCYAWPSDHRPLPAGARYVPIDLTFRSASPPLARLRVVP